MTKLTNTHLSRHQVNLIVYVLLVAAVAGILFGYQHHVSVKLNQQDRISCANRRVLITNQRLVLRIIRRNIHVLLSWSLDAADRQFMLNSAELLDQAEAHLLATPSCPLPKGFQP